MGTNQVILSGDGACLASSSKDKTIKLWEVENWQEVDAFSMNKVRFNGTAFSPDGRLLASANATYDVESKQVAISSNGAGTFLALRLSLLMGPCLPLPWRVRRLNCGISPVEGRCTSLWGRSMTSPSASHSNPMAHCRSSFRRTTRCWPPDAMIVRYIYGAFHDSQFREVTRV